MNNLLLLIRLMIASRLTTMPALIAHGRELAFDLNLPVAPVGVGNTKTGTASTYRPVGATCPSTCPYLGKGCYAEHGLVTIHERRAPKTSLASVVSAAIAIIAAVKCDALARLHVSGDFYVDGRLDETYLTELIEVSETIQGLTNTSLLAWTYTHAPPEEMDGWRERLHAAGVVVLYSDRVEPGGAVIWPFRSFRTLQDLFPLLTLVRCPAQLTGTTCRECRLCPEARNRGLTIVFDPHGRHRQKLQILYPEIASTPTTGHPP
jgi:hypothetical protein